MFDSFSRGRYATDASLYQMMPLGVLSPKSEDDIRAAIDIAREQGRARSGAWRRDIAMRADRERTRWFWITRSISTISLNWMSKASDASCAPALCWMS